MHIAFEPSILFRWRPFRTYDWLKDCAGLYCHQRALQLEGLHLTSVAADHGQSGFLLGIPEHLLVGSVSANCLTGFNAVPRGPTRPHAE